MAKRQVIVAGKVKKTFKTVTNDTIHSNKKYLTQLFDKSLNLQITNPMFKDFENKLNDLGFRRVPVTEKTNSGKFKSKTAIDHIFIPKAWKIVSCGTFETKELEQVTDHKAVYVDVIM